MIYLVIAVVTLCVMISLFVGWYITTKSWLGKEFAKAFKWMYDVATVVILGGVFVISLVFDLRIHIQLWLAGVGTVAWLISLLVKNDKLRAVCYLVCTIMSTCSTVVMFKLG